MPFKGGPHIMLEIPNEETGQIEKKYVPMIEIFNRIWEDYIRGHIPNDYTREMLRELGLRPCEVFHMMEMLQGGKGDFDKNNYTGGAYT